MMKSINIMKNSRLWKQVGPFLKNFFIFGSVSLILAAILDCFWYSCCFAAGGEAKNISNFRDMYFFGIGLITFTVGVAGFLFTMCNALLYTKNELLSRELKLMKIDLKQAQTNVENARKATEIATGELRRMQLNKNVIKQLSSLRIELFSELQENCEHMRMLESQGSPFSSSLIHNADSIEKYLQMRDFVATVMAADCNVEDSHLYSILRVSNNIYQKIAADMIYLCLPNIEEGSRLYNQLVEIRDELRSRKPS